MSIEPEQELTSASAGAPKSEKPTNRRRWLQRAVRASLVGGLGAAGYAHWIEPHWVETVRRELPIAGLPESLQGRTLLQLSDIHVGAAVDDEYLIAAFQAAQALQPDIVVLTGDYLTWHADFTWDTFDRVYSHVPRGRLATLGCLGNHDYGIRWSNARIADEVVQRLADAGVDVLCSAARDLQGLTIAGIDDLWGNHWNRQPLEDVLSQNHPDIVLCHNPDVCDMALWHHFQGWILSGHTHGGQCRPLWGPPPILPVKNKRYTAGEFDLGDGRWLYINRGLGHLQQVRFCVRPEVTLFTLTGEYHGLQPV